MNLSIQKLCVLKLLLCCFFLIYNGNLNAQTTIVTEVEACIGDTITAPMTPFDTCPFGPYPPEADPNGDNYIIKILDYTMDSEIIFIVLGEGSFNYQLPPELNLTNIDGELCSTDLYTYNITLKENCANEPIVYNFTACEGDDLSVFVPIPQGSCNIEHIETPNDPDNPIIQFLGFQQGDIFNFTVLASGSFTIDEIAGCDGLPKPVIVNLTINPECIIDNSYETDNCICDVCGVNNPMDLPWVQEYFDTYPEISFLSGFWDGNKQQAFFEPVPYTYTANNEEAYNNGYSLTLDCSGNIACYFGDTTFPVDTTCFSFLDFGNLQELGVIYRPDGESHCGDDGITYETLCALECSGATEVDCFPPDFTICPGDTLLIEGPSSLPAGPQGPPGSLNDCTNVTSVTISPMDGVISQTDYGFYVAPQTNVTYTLSSTATSGGGPGSPGCTPQTLNEEIIVKIDSTCYAFTEDYTMCKNDTIETFTSHLVDYAVIDEPNFGTLIFGTSATGPVDAVFYNPYFNFTGTDSFTIEFQIGTQYTTYTYNISIGDCGLPDLPSTYEATICNTDTLGPLNQVDGPEPIFLEEPSNGTLEVVYSTTYYAVGAQYIPNPGFTGIDYFSVKYFSLGLIDSSIVNYEIEVIDCTIDPEPYVATDIFVLDFITVGNNCADECGSIDQITGFLYEGSSYFGLYNLGDGPDCPTVNTNNITFLDCNGDVYCDNSAANDLCSDDFFAAAFSGEIVWSNDNICNPDIPTEPGDTEYDWLNDLLDVNNCYENVLEFTMGSYSFIYVKTAADCEDLGKLYLNTGELYCTDADNFDCLGAYGLNESEGTSIFTYEDVPTEPNEPNTPYNWLNDVLASSDCCNANAAIEFNLGGSYSFIYVSSETDCGGFGSLYLNTGELYCNDASNFDCLAAYGLDINQGTVLWDCEGGPTEPTEPVDFEDFPWLNNLINANDCCTNESVLVFPAGSYSFVYIKTGTSCGGLGTLYLNTGELYCTDANNFDCLGAYGLNESDATVIWTCGTDDKPAIDSDDTTNDDLSKQSAKLENNNSLNNIDNIPVEMKIYPNPSNGLVNISLNTTYEGDQTIRILDLSGRTITEVRFTKAQNQVFQMDLSDLPDGLYLIEYSNANILNVEKVMVRH